MFVLLLAVLSASPQKLAVGRVEVSGVKEPTSGFFISRLAQAMGERQLPLITPEEIGVLLGAERQRQLLGCEASQCALELAGGLGAEGILVGHIARLESVVQVDLVVLSSSNGTHLAQFSKRLARDVDVLEALDEAAGSLVGQLRDGRAPQSRRGWLFLPVGVVGLAAGAAGAVFLLDAQSVHLQLTGASALHGEPMTLAAEGTRSQLLGALGVGIGGAALAAAVVLFFVQSAPAVQVAVLPSGRGFVVTGVFP
jgi:hypothetical protein